MWCLFLEAIFLVLSEELLLFDLGQSLNWDFFTFVPFTRLFKVFIISGPSLGHSSLTPILWEAKVLLPRAVEVLQDKLRILFVVLAQVGFDSFIDPDGLNAIIFLFFV